MKILIPASIVVGAVIALCTTAAFAAVCDVPSAPHPTIQDAVDDLACTEIVLAAQVFAESVTIDRSLEMRGASSTTTIIEGRVVVNDEGCHVHIC